jgi:hypothetical protein
MAKHAKGKFQFGAFISSSESESDESEQEKLILTDDTPSASYHSSDLAQIRSASPCFRSRIL